MKKKITLYSLMTIMISLISFSCSNDDKDDEPTNPLDTASATVAGTYIGTYDRNDFSKTLLIEDLGNNTVRVSGNNKIPVEIEVEFLEGSNVVTHVSFEQAGLLAYEPSTETLAFTAKETPENIKAFYFNGKRQK